MSRIAGDLREYSRWMAGAGRIGADDLTTLEWLCDKADAEHERRMEQCRCETRRAFARYLRSIIWEYVRGIKRKRRSE